MFEKWKFNYLGQEDLLMTIKLQLQYKTKKIYRKSKNSKVFLCYERFEKR